jgi:hypothetical protein
MQFFPHNTPLSLTSTAISASTTVTASLIANFASFNVSTASIALNITGSPGPAGTNYTKTGESGSQGDKGDTGYRGNSVFLLSSSWSTGSCVGVTCYSFSFISAKRGICDPSITTTYYSTLNSIIDATTPIYYNAICTTPVISASLGAFGGIRWSTNTLGTASYIAPCSGDPF